jgi:uncharacterized lipoprotein YajG
MGRKRFIIFLLMAILALALCTVALTLVDVTNVADPSRAETWLASSVFQMKVGAQRPRQAVGE